MDNLDSLCERIGLLTGWPADDPRWSRLQHYLERVRDAGLSLVSARDRARLVERHLLPSLAALDLIPVLGQLMDVGSGGGFPAIPIALARPALQVICVESSERKAAFLKRVSRETSLTNLDVVPERVEGLALPGPTMDIVTARAATGLPELIAVTDRLLAPCGKWILWKGRAWRSEGDLTVLGVTLTEERDLPDGGRLLVLTRIQREASP